VTSLAHPGPIYADFFAGADQHILSQDELDLHTYGKTFDTTWVTIHDTAVHGTSPFNSITLAKAAHATPFKRPENGQFRPGSNFTEFYFDETATRTTAPRPARLMAGSGAFIGWC
jgi:hypothetical protein